MYETTTKLNRSQLRMLIEIVKNTKHSLYGLYLSFSAQRILNYGAQKNENAITYAELELCRMCGRADLMELSGNEEVVMCGVTLCCGRRQKLTFSSAAYWEIVLYFIQVYWKTTTG